MGDDFHPPWAAPRRWHPRHCLFTFRNPSQSCLAIINNKRFLKSYYVQTIVLVCGERKESGPCLLKTFSVVSGQRKTEML